MKKKQNQTKTQTKQKQQKQKIQFSLGLGFQSPIINFFFFAHLNPQIVTNATQLLPHFLSIRAEIVEFPSSFRWGFDHSLLIMDAQPVESSHSHITTIATSTFSSISIFIFFIPFLRF